MAKQQKAWRSVELAEEECLTAGLVHHRWPSWSLDGKWLAFHLENAWVMVDRRGRVARTFESADDGPASFGKDGAFAFARSGEIWMSPGGSAPAVRLLGGDGGRYLDPAWSPDGSQLVFAWSDGGPSRLLSLEVATGARHTLTADPHRADGRPVFSSDGNWLFFEGNDTLFAMELATRLLSRATPEGPRFHRPAPLSSELLVAEHHEGGRVRLALVDWRRVRARSLLESDAEQREPAACLTPKGKLRLAWSSMPPATDGKPRRADINIARVRGVDATSEENLPLAPGLEHALEAAR